MSETDTTTYLVDTSVWIHLYEESYPPDVFPGLYRTIATAAGSGRIRSPRQVKVELDDNKSGAGIGGWVRSLHPPIFMTETRPVARLVGEILVKFPALVKGVTREEADPYLVAHAATNSGFVVVTDEAPTTNGGKPKIPNVCLAYQVKYMSTLQLLRELKVCL